MRLFYFIPNFITSLNILSGSIGIILAFENKLDYACYFVGISAILDFLDGFLAKILNACSEFGKQLDSLADVISFGLLPSVLLFQLNKLILIKSSIFSGFTSFKLSILLFMLSAFLIVIFSALRLAKFNIDKSQESDFRGLPSPANAILIASFPLIAFNFENTIYSEILLTKTFSVGFAIVSSFLLISNIKMFSLKFKNINFVENIHRYIFLAISILLIILLKELAIPAIIIFYIILSIIINYIIKKQD